MALHAIAACLPHAPSGYEASSASELLQRVAAVVSTKEVNAVGHKDTRCISDLSIP